MKQKIVIRVPSPMSHGKSCFDCFRGHNKEKKALQTAASFAGVNQASYVGDDKGKIEVAGDQVDAVKLTITLKKMVGYAVLESVAEAKEGGDEKKEKEGEGDKEKDGANQPPPVGIYPHSPYTIYNCY